VRIYADFNGIERRAGGASPSTPSRPSDPWRTRNCGWGKVFVWSFSTGRTTKRISKPTHTRVSIRSWGCGGRRWSRGLSVCAPSRAHERCRLSLRHVSLPAWWAHQEERTRGRWRMPGLQDPDSRADHPWSRHCGVEARARPTALRDVTRVVFHSHFPQRNSSRTLCSWGGATVLHRTSGWRVVAVFRRVLCGCGEPFAQPHEPGCESSSAAP